MSELTSLKVNVNLGDVGSSYVLLSTHSGLEKERTVPSLVGF